MARFARSQPFYRSQGYIGGKWKKSEGEFPVFNPATGEQIGPVEDMGTDNGEHAVGKAHGALKPWRLTTCKALLVMFIVFTCFSAAQGQANSYMDDYMNTITSWGYTSPTNYDGQPLSSGFVPLLAPFNAAIEVEINKQIYRELFVHYTFKSMTYHFQRADIYMRGFSRFFKKAAERGMSLADKLMEYQNKRGGQIKLQNIEKPYEDNWGSGYSAMQYAFTLEQELTVALQNLVQVAIDNKDGQTASFIEDDSLVEHMNSVKELANYLNMLKQIESDVLGEFQFDSIILHGHAPDPE